MTEHFPNCSNIDLNGADNKSYFFIIHDGDNISFGLPVYEDGQSIIYGVNCLHETIPKSTPVKWLHYQKSMFVGNFFELDGYILIFLTLSFHIWLVINRDVKGFSYDHKEYRWKEGEEKGRFSVITVIFEHGSCGLTGSLQLTRYDDDSSIELASISSTEVTITQKGWSKGLLYHVIFGAAILRCDFPWSSVLAM